MQFPKLVLFLLAVLCLCSCKKEERVFVPLEESPDLWACHEAITWDASSIKTALFGEWEAVYLYCHLDPEDANGEDLKGFSVNFKDEFLELKVNGEVIEEWEWTVVGGDLDGYEVQVEAAIVPSLQGVILICDNLVQFNSAHNDGCDVTFRKVE